MHTEGDRVRSSIRRLEPGNAMRDCGSSSGGTRGDSLSVVVGWSVWIMSAACAKKRRIMHHRRAPAMPALPGVFGVPALRRERNFSLDKILLRLCRDKFGEARKFHNKKESLCH